jgi:hypothetical protein
MTPLFSPCLKFVFVLFLNPFLAHILSPTPTLLHIITYKTFSPIFANYKPLPISLQRQNTEISKQICPEKEYQGLSPNFHIHVSVSDLYIPTIGMPILLDETCIDRSWD